MNLKTNGGEKKSLFGGGNDGSSSSSSSSDGDSDSNSSSDMEKEMKLTVNKKYARDYQTRKSQEELQQVRQRGDYSDDEGDSSDEEEDEDANLLTSSVNLQFLKTMKALKSKEASIYDPESSFFSDPQERTEKDGVEASENKKRKPQRFKDVLREQILEQMHADDEDSNTNNVAEAKTRQTSNSKLAYDEQQEDLRKAFLTESNADEDNSNEKEDDWMVMKKKGLESQDDSTAKEIQEQFQMLEKLSNKDSFKDPRGEVKDGESFLIDYIKKKKWIDQDDYDQDAESDTNDNDVTNHVEDDDSLDDIDRADDFEASYNFRFEQAAAAAPSSGANLSIKTYARGQTMNTVRRQDTTRKDKRLARKERKEAERKAKEEQLKRLKNAKKQEMKQKLTQVRGILGSADEEAIDEVAIMKMLEGDYDPEKFEKAMQDAYGDDFYQKEDGEWKTDVDVRDALKDDQDGDDLVGQDGLEGGMYDGEGDDDEEGGGERDDDWDEDDNEEYVGGDSTEETELEKKLKSKMQEEMYKLDYEDIIAGMPTRFKYRQVESNDYGLTTQEILLARDSTLKQFVSLKKLAPYNEDGEHHVGSKKRRRFREMLKQDLADEYEEENPEPEEENVQEMEEDEPQKKKRRRLKKGKKKKKSEEQNHGTSDIQNEKFDPTEDSLDNQKRRRKKKGKKGGNSSEEKDGNRDSSLSKVVSSSGKLGIESASFDGEKAEKIDDTKKKQKKRKKKKKSTIASLTSSRLASYGL